MLLVDLDIERLGDENALKTQSGRFGLEAQVSVGKIGLDKEGPGKFFERWDCSRGTKVRLI